MGLLQDIVHTITGNHGTPQALAEPVRGMASQFTPLAQPMQFAQYMNKDGSGGGFGPHNPSAAPQLQVRPQGQFQQQHANLGISTMPVQGRPSPGLIPMQNGGFGGPGYTANLQPTQQTYWQNTNGRPQNMVNPQVQDNGYFFDN